MNNQIEDRCRRLMALVTPHLQDADLARVVIQSFGPLEATVSYGTIVDGNKTLAIVGDSEATSALSRMKFREGATKGEMDFYRQTQLNNDRLASLCDDCGLTNLIVLNPGLTVVSTKMKATAFEALLGAIALDSGRDALDSVLQHLNVIQRTEL